MKISKKVSPAFADFLFDWYYETYLLVGGYGSGKSYHVVLKLILKLMEEKRTCLVVREVFDTMYESCFSLFREILEDMGIATDDRWEFKRSMSKVLLSKSPMTVVFKNGSRVIFKGMDKSLYTNIKGVGRAHTSLEVAMKYLVDAVNSTMLGRVDGKPVNDIYKDALKLFKVSK